jgi:hypothetical protein
MCYKWDNWKWDEFAVSRVFWENHAFCGAITMYQLLPDQFGQPAQCIKRLADNAFIPFDPANRDYAEYLEWLAEGNEPLPADSPAE